MRTTVAPTAKVPPPPVNLTEEQIRALEVKKLARKRFREGVGEMLLMVAFFGTIVMTVLATVLLGVHFLNSDIAYPSAVVYSLLVWDVGFVTFMTYSGIRYQYDKDELIAEYLLYGSDDSKDEGRDPRARLHHRARGWELSGKPLHYTKMKSYDPSQEEPF